MNFIHVIHSPSIQKKLSLHIAKDVLKKCDFFCLFKKRLFTKIIKTCIVDRKTLLNMLDVGLVLSNQRTP